MHFVNELRYTLTISVFDFPILIHFTNQVASKQSLARKLNLIFLLISINWHINIPLWTSLGQRKDEKNFTRCYIIALKF